jgi:biotin carboxylase
LVLLRGADGEFLTRVLLIAATTGYQIRSFGAAAADMGVRLVFASDRCDRLDDPWWDGAIPVRFHDTAAAVRDVTAAFNGSRPDGIVAVGDRPAVLAAHIAESFGMAGHPPAAAAASRNKLATRRAQHAAGLPTPRFSSMAFDRNADTLSKDVGYPAVVKPLALSGSRGVVRVDTPAEFSAAVDRLRRLMQARDVRIERDDAHGQFLVESFVPGAEYAIEALLTRGSVRVLAIFDKPDPLDGPFFEETIYRAPSLAPADTQARIVTAVQQTCAALGLHHGPVHAECRVSRGDVYVLEAAARPIGGLCSRALRFAPGGASLEELLLRHALGEDVSSYTREALASGVMMIPIPRRGVFRGVDGVAAASAVPGVEHVQITAKVDATLVPLPEGRSYLGFIFARAEEPAAVDRALREAHGRLRFQIERDVAVL